MASGQSLMVGHEVVSAHTRPLTESVAALAHPKGSGHKRLPVSGRASQMQTVTWKTGQSSPHPGADF